MKYRMLVMGLVVGFIGAPLGLFGQVFQTIEYQKALSLADEKSQLIWLNFYSPMDELCVQMDEAVFNERNIRAVSRSFVTVRLDTSAAISRELMSKFCISELPASIFVNSAGEEIERIIGYWAAPLFLRKVRKIRSGVDTFAALEKAYDSNPMNGELAFQLAKKLVLMGRKMDIFFQ